MTSQKDCRQPNNLIHEKSPYLLQHAYNPVNWYAWGDEPFAIARRENKPIFLSIGYSTCHWCHVMEKESFENEAIAALLNKDFISIKVDREERPDIDQIYMIATQAITGGGGWPMSVFLFENKKPFYAGTYFPPEPRYNHPGFPDLLGSIMKAWQNNPKGLRESAEKITTYLQASGQLAAADSLNSTWLETGFKALQESYDNRYHGFGTTNKFPRPACLDFLLQFYYRNRDTLSHAMFSKTLRAMAMGGMYDHIGGGFHRYAVDRQWRIPHFEKMLYDQAQLITTYLHGYQQSGGGYFAEIAEETIEYVLRDLQHPDGGLYSAEDADSENPYDTTEHGEGAFYLWKESEIRNLLEKEEAEIFIAAYEVQQNGNALEDPAGEFTGRNILFKETSIDDLAKRFGKDKSSISNLLQESKSKLLRVRNTRTRPHMDDKIITAWNGLMISSLGKAARILNNSRYLTEAKRVTGFIIDNLLEGDDLRRRWREGDARFDGVLEDYAFFIQGLIDLYQACHEPKYLQLAVELSGKQIELFADQEEGGFFNSRESAGILTRIKESYDGAEPSGNSVAALNFLHLGRMLNKPEWIDVGEKTIRAFGTMLEKHGSAMPLMLTALELALAPPQQLVIVGDKDSEETKSLLLAADGIYKPHVSVLFADNGQNQEILSQYLESINDMAQSADGPRAYFCENFSCKSPTAEPAVLRRLLQSAQNC